MVVQSGTRAKNIWRRNGKTMRRRDRKVYHPRWMAQLPKPVRRGASCFLHSELPHNDTAAVGNILNLQGVQVMREKSKACTATQSD